MNPTVTPSAWKTDNYKFVEKAFHYTYADRMNKLAPILGDRTINSIDLQLTGSGGYGELQPYDGNNLNIVEKHRGFNTSLTPQEFSSSVVLGRKQILIDKSGECRRTGTVLGNAAAMTVYLQCVSPIGHCDGDHRRFRAGCAAGRGVNRTDHTGYIGFNFLPVCFG